MARPDGTQKEYRAPTLKVYGGMAELTASGTGSQGESTGMGMQEGEGAQPNRQHP